MALAVVTFVAHGAREIFHAINAIAFPLHVPLQITVVLVRFPTVGAHEGSLFLG